MAAPTPAARVTPTGFKMADGFQTLLVFTSVTNIQFWEKTVKPPALDGGDKIDTSTMLNSAWRTSDHRHLKTLNDVTASVMYDPDVIANILTLINRSDTITVLFPDTSTLCFYGFLRMFEPQEHREGEPPMSNLTICPTNWDAANGVEAGPVFTPAAGT